VPPPSRGRRGDSPKGRGPEPTAPGTTILPNQISLGETKAGVTHIFVGQEPPFKEVPAMEAAELDYRILKSPVLRKNSMDDIG
jgi:hypothetical protein